MLRRIYRPEVFALKHESRILGQWSTLYLVQGRAKTVIHGPNSTEPDLFHHGEITYRERGLSENATVMRWKKYVWLWYEVNPDPSCNSHLEHDAPFGFWLHCCYAVRCRNFGNFSKRVNSRSSSFSIFFQVRTAPTDTANTVHRAGHSLRQASSST